MQINEYFERQKKKSPLEKLAEYILTRFPELKKRVEDVSRPRNDAQHPPEELPPDQHREEPEDEEPRWMKLARRDTIESPSVTLEGKQAQTCLKNMLTGDEADAETSNFMEAVIKEESVGSSEVVDIPTDYQNQKNVIAIRIIDNATSGPVTFLLRKKNLPHESMKDDRARVDWLCQQIVVAISKEKTIESIMGTQF